MRRPGRRGPLSVAGTAPPMRPIHRPAQSAAPATAQLWRGAWMALLLAACLAAVLVATELLSSPQWRVGQVATATMYAPYTFTYQDTARTAQLAQRAADMTPTQYRSNGGAQQQAAVLATAVLQAAQGMRSGTASGHGAVDAAALGRLSAGAVSTDLATRLLALNTADLTSVRSLVLEALRAASKQAVYPAQVAAREPAPAFPPSLPSGEVRSVAGALYYAFLRPNYLPDPVLTARAQKQAMALVVPVRTDFQRGQVLVRSGDVVDATTLAVLRAAGLTGSAFSGQLLVADLMICLVVAGLLHGYLVSVRSPILLHLRQLALLDTLMVTSLLAVAFVRQGGPVQDYVFPAAALGMLLTVLLNEELSIVAMGMWAVLAGWYLGGSFELATYYLVTGLVGALLVRTVRRSSEFFLAGITAGGVGLATILAFRLLHQGYDWLGFSTYAAAAAVSGGLGAALTLGSLSLLGRIFGVTTALHLLELSHPNHPLLRRLMQEAPGTYHHSIMIGNLAERAAEQIGADALLVRVAAYFHDIGKLVSPRSFAENQAGIANVHEQLEPRDSAQLIKQHIRNGVQLARQHHLPEVLEDAIWQHHGTNMVSFFYHQAVARHGEAQVDAEDYRYPGPRPQTREMAILMLADGVEAAVRASPGVDGDQLRAIIHRLTQERVRDGQLDECSLTLRDLAIIEESFATVLQGVSHPRVQYPAALPAAAGND